MAARNKELKNLHPVVRKKVETLIQKLKDENIPLRLFEGFRTPKRQAQLYSQGRTIPGSKVTNANAWQSLHQYGVACDFVLYIDGNWSWSTSGNNGNYWSRYHELAGEVGLKPLSWETPHIELVGATWRSLYDGGYPSGGNLDWAENLEAAIIDWTGYPSAPPMPDNIPMRPPLGRDEEGENQEYDRLFLNRYRVNARRGLHLRAGPGIEYDIIKSLPNGAVVFSLSNRSDWCQIDLEGDGTADGFCHNSFLVKLH
ncbi:MAG: M15 family metallopeptidase [Methylococcales bacterium]|nr:M15 family metallopeptidase [Methylococcales bacterium]